MSSAVIRLVVLSLGRRLIDSCAGLLCAVVVLAPGAAVAAAARSTPAGECFMDAHCNDANPCTVDACTIDVVMHPAPRAPVSVHAVDVDGDGDLDVLSASAKDDRIAWYENDGAQSFTTHLVASDADSAQSVFATDVDGDGDLDVLAATEGLSPDVEATIVN